MITKKYYKLIRVSHADSGYFYIKNVSNEVGEFSFVKQGSQSSPNTEYSLDGITWTSYDFTTLPTISVNMGSNIYLRGTSWPISGRGAYFSVNFSKNFEVGGNLLSLINYNTMTTETTIGGNNQSGYLVYLFKNQTNLKSVDNLSLGNVNSVENEGGFYGAMSYMFYGCSNLEIGLNLDKITNVTGGSFSRFYQNCSKISEVTTPNIQNLTTSVLTDWLQNAGTSATGTKVVNVPTGATITTNSTSGIPTGWTRADY